MKDIHFSKVNITNGFWKEKQCINRSVTVHTVYETFKDSGRFDALRCDWKEGEDNKGRVLGHIYYDSDIAKWIEGAAYILQKEQDFRIEQIIDEAIENIVNNSDDNGYFNSHFLVTRKDKRFTYRSEHELYCAGHLIEAALAYYQATGKREFLDTMCRYADYIYEVFKVNKTSKFTTPGHPEIELALVKLFRVTDNIKYLELSKFFIDSRGDKSEVESFMNSPFPNNSGRLWKDYTDVREKQDHKPVREFDTAEGHCVCCLYLLCGMADVAYETKDTELAKACRRCFLNIVNKKSYITGGVGSIRPGECFGEDYYLPNRTAYSETCASIAMVFFAQRMLHLDLNSEYADCIERCMYNSVLSGVSLDGGAFFYENPLEISPKLNNMKPCVLPQFANSRESIFSFAKTKRPNLYECSCCPPNILRFIASVGNYMYSYTKDTVYIHQYATSYTEDNGIIIEQTTEYPSNGEVSIKCVTMGRKIAVRIPGWCQKFKVNKKYEMENGYAVFDSTVTELNITFDMPVTAIRANRCVYDNVGRVAIMRGPVVYCAEGVDNGEDVSTLKVDINNDFEIKESEFLLPTIHTTAYQYPESSKLYSVATKEFKTVPLTLIPYFAFANRGETEMRIWLLEK